VEVWVRALELYSFFEGDTFQDFQEDNYAVDIASTYYDANTGLNLDTWGWDSAPSR